MVKAQQGTRTGSGGRVCAFAAACLIVWGGAVVALTLPETARLTGERDADFDTVILPAGPFGADGPETVSGRGAVTQRAFRLSGTSLTTLQVLEPLRAELEAGGARVLYECADAECGGFDFRYALDLLPEPQMHVDLGNFRYLLAAGPEPDALTALVVSRSAGAAHIHVTTLGAAAAPVAALVADGPEIALPPETGIAVPEDPAQATGGAIGDALLSESRVVLDDLEFGTGSSALQERAFASLAELAAYLNATPEARVVLVGHSDAVGDLDTNIDLSRRRAQAVARRMVETHGVNPAQLRAEGVGYLAPLASNRTPEGRAVNRRVEAIKAETE